MAPALASWFERYIRHTPGVQGGAACIAGTRTPVRSVTALFRTYDGDIAEILRAYPHLTELQVCAALAYADAHPDEMAAEEERQERALAELLARR